MAEPMDVMPSAVSQRIKALEQRPGKVLVVREKVLYSNAQGNTDDAEVMKQ